MGRQDALTAKSPSAAAARPLTRVRLRPWLRRRASQIGYRIAGLPIASRALRGRGQTPEAVIRAAYSRRYWRPRTAVEMAELGLGLLLCPVVVLSLALKGVWRNGGIVRRRDGRPIHRQLLDQLRLYVAAGAFPPTYYVFELSRRPDAAFARGFVYRSESKGGVLSMLKEARPPASVVSDKVLFEARCRARGIAAIPVLAAARDGVVEWLGDAGGLAVDWVVKPIAGKGGRGIERWDHAGGDRFRGADGAILGREALLRRIAARSRAVPLFIQPRVENHAALRELANGALSTVRALTCLDERGEPELLGAAMRMAIGRNRIVDNFHAGGIAAAIDFETGLLGRASNLGADARLGWLERHPDSGALIHGRRLPHWEQLRPFVERAHRAFSDRILIGWDVAVTADGLQLVEANGVPDLDIMQRTARRGWMAERLGQLLAHHVAAGSGIRQPG